MKIALLGATGAVGGYFLEKALAANHQIIALARTPEKLSKNSNLTAVKGDVTNTSDVVNLVKGCDVVVSCLGNVKGATIMEQATEAILEAAKAQPNQPRCMFISSIGCGGTSWIVKQILSVVAGHASFTDYERADRRITQERDVSYVLVRPAVLKDRPGNGKYRAFRGDGTFARPLAKEDVANFLIEALTNSEWNGNSGIQLAGRK